MKSCVKWKETENGRRCAKFADGDKEPDKMEALEHDAFGDLSGLADEISPVGKGVYATDVILGAAIGAGGVVAASKALKYLPISVQAPLLKYWAIAAGLIVGGGVYFVERGISGPRKAYGHALGVVVGSSLPALFAMGLSKLGFADLVQVDLGGYGRGMGMVIDDPAPNGYGMIIDDQLRGYSREEQLLTGGSSYAEMAALSMGPDHDGLDDLVEIAI